MTRYLVLMLILGLTPALAQVPVVEVRPLADVLVDLERTAPAEVVSLNDSLLAAEVNAVVAVIEVDVGSTVAAGDLLLELDGRDFQLQLDAANAGLASARARHQDAAAKLQRAQRLAQSDYVSEDELLTRETALAIGAAEIDNAQAQVAIARRQLEKTRILAPFDGVIVERFAQQGAYLTIGSPLLRITQTQPLELDVEVPASQAASLAGASELHFVAGSESWPVTLLRLSPVVEAGRRSQRARLAFEDQAPSVGQSGALHWRVAGGQLPASLLSRRGNALGVFVYDQGLARLVPLPLAQEGRPAEVHLPPDLQVIVQGQDRLQDGDSIQLR